MNTMQSTNANVNRCRLLELPAEIRNVIYEMMGGDTPEVIEVDLSDPKSIILPDFSLANTCRQIRQEYTSEFYGSRRVNISSQLLSPYIAGAEKAAETLDRFVKHHVVLRKPEVVELHAGKIVLRDFPEMWSNIEAPFRLLSKTCKKFTLSFDTSYLDVGRLCIPMNDPDSIVACLQTTYFSDERKRVFEATKEEGEADDAAVWFLLMTEHIVRSFRPLWWVREGAKGRWKVRYGEKIKTWYTMGNAELQKLLWA